MPQGSEGLPMVDQGCRGKGVFDRWLWLISYHDEKHDNQQKVDCGQKQKCYPPSQQSRQPHQRRRGSDVAGSTDGEENRRKGGESASRKPGGHEFQRPHQVAGHAHPQKHTGDHQTGHGFAAGEGRGSAGSHQRKNGHKGTRPYRVQIEPHRDLHQRKGIKKSGGNNPQAFRIQMEILHKVGGYDGYGRSVKLRKDEQSAADKVDEPATVFAQFQRCVPRLSDI